MEEWLSLYLVFENTYLKNLEEVSNSFSRNIPAKKWFKKLSIIFFENPKFLKIFIVDTSLEKSFSIEYLCNNNFNLRILNLSLKDATLEI